MAHDAGFEMTREQLWKGWNDAANSDDPYDSDKHRQHPKGYRQETVENLDVPAMPEK